MAITVEQWTNYTKVVFDSATNFSTTFLEEMSNPSWTEAQRWERLARHVPADVRARRPACRRAS